MMLVLFFACLTSCSSADLISNMQKSNEDHLARALHEQQLVHCLKEKAHAHHNVCRLGLSGQQDHEEVHQRWQTVQIILNRSWRCRAVRPSSTACSKKQPRPRASPQLADFTCVVLEETQYVGDVFWWDRRVIEPEYLFDTATEELVRQLGPTAGGHLPCDKNSRQELSKRNAAIATLQI